MTETPEPYKWQMRIRALLAGLFGIVFALFPVKIALHLRPSLSAVALIVVYVGSVILLGVVARLGIDSFAEFDDQIPISSQERRRRTKEFYDWLNTQGRR